MNKQLPLFLLLLVFFCSIPSFGQTSTGSIPPGKRALLHPITGRWITQTTVVDSNGNRSYKTLGSDVYQWSPDGNFIVHTAYGIRDSSGFGAMEIIGYNPATDDFTSYNFNPDGSFNMDKLIIRQNTWTWTGKTVRSTGIMDKAKRQFNVKHASGSDSTTYTFFMESQLIKGAEF